MRPYMLPGESPLPFQPSAPSRPSGFIRVLIVTWLLGGVTIAAWKYAVPPAKEPTPTVPAPTSPQVHGDDVLHHMDTANSRLESADVALRRAESQLKKTAVSLEQNLLYVESRQLQHVAASLVESRRGIQEARQEVSLVVNSIKENSK